MFEKIKKSVRKISGSGPWPILLLALAHLLNIFSNHYPTIPVYNLLKELLIYGGGGIAAALILKYFFSDWIRPNSVVLVLLLAEFYFSPLHTYWKSLIGGGFWSSYTLLLPLLALFLLTGIYLSVRKLRCRFVQLITAYSILMLPVSVSQLAIVATDQKTHSVGHTFRMLEKKPDIVLILLDEYAGAASLKSFFQYDNSDFASKMKSIGFQEVKGSSSVYNLTVFSMASLFDMQSLNVPDSNVSDLSSWRNGILRINRNNWTNFLNSNGYKIHNASIFPFNEEPPFEDVFNLHIVGAARLHHFNTSHTICRDLSYLLYTKNLFGQSKKTLQRRLIRYLNEFLRSQTAIVVQNPAGPDFHYIHLYLPHNPYLLNETGQESLVEDAFDTPNKNAYLSYLKYTNNRLLEMLKAMRKNNEETIFIVMSDHGWKNFRMPSPEGIEFNTILFVKGLKQPLPDSIQVPNILPHVLDQLYDSAFPKSKSKSVFLYD